MDAIQLLKQQHDEAARLFRKIGSLGEPEEVEKERLFIQLADTLAIHASIEERIFYPAVRARKTEAQVDRAFEEHLDIKRMLSRLLDLQVVDEEFDRELESLREYVEHHVEEEEGELLPVVERLLGRETLDALGEQMLDLQGELEEEGEPRMVVRVEMEEMETR
jgi:hemerythrin-like domain-containing protein